MANRKKLSKKLIKKITKLIDEGQTNISAICSLTGISRSVWYKWEAHESTQFAVHLTRARAKEAEKEAESLVVESKRSLLLLLHGFYLTTVQENSKYGVDGKPITETTITQTFVPPDTQLTIFILTNIDSANFANRLQRRLNIKTRGLYKAANRIGARIQTIDEANEK